MEDLGIPNRDKWSNLVMAVETLRELLRPEEEKEVFVKSFLGGDV
jgi:hypothetical protein